MKIGIHECGRKWVVLMGASEAGSTKAHGTVTAAPPSSKVNICQYSLVIFHNLQLLSCYMLLSSWNDASPGHNIAGEPRLGLRPPAFADASFRKLEVHGGSLSCFFTYVRWCLTINIYNKWHAWNNGHSIMCLEIWSWRSTSCALPGSCT